MRMDAPLPPPTARMKLQLLSLLIVAFQTATGAASTIERIWLTHASNDPSKIVINWETETPSSSQVEYGTAPDAPVSTTADVKEVTLHHVELPLQRQDAVYHYRVRSGPDASPVASFKSCPTQKLRVLVVGDWGFAQSKDLSALAKEDAHLLITAGDNVPSLHEKGREGTKAFSALIDTNRALFRRTPFMPILGNHDREITSRGPKPPPHAVYDVEAQAYREFFALPGEEWRWYLDLPAFDVRFIATDLNHIQDFGTTWQTCHAWQPDSPQFQWFAQTMSGAKQGFVFTLMNEKQGQVYGLTKGAWHEQFRKGSALISGFGYFADRAALTGGLPYFNTCLKGDGDNYKDPQSKFFAQQDNYLLLTFTAGSPTMTVQFKNLRGDVLDTTVIQKRR